MFEHVENLFFSTLIQILFSVLVEFCNEITILLLLLLYDGLHLAIKERLHKKMILFNEIITIV